MLSLFAERISRSASRSTSPFLSPSTRPETTEPNVCLGLNNFRIRPFRRRLGNFLDGARFCSNAWRALVLAVEDDHERLLQHLRSRSCRVCPAQGRFQQAQGNVLFPCLPCQVHSRPIEAGADAASQSDERLRFYGRPNQYEEASESSGGGQEVKQALPTLVLRNRLIYYFFGSSPAGHRLRLYQASAYPLEMDQPALIPSLPALNPSNWRKPSCGALALS